MAGVAKRGYEVTLVTIETHTDTVTMQQPSTLMKELTSAMRSMSSGRGDGKKASKMIIKALDMMTTNDDLLTTMEAHIGTSTLGKMLQQLTLPDRPDLFRHFADRWGAAVPGDSRRTRGDPEQSRKERRKAARRRQKDARKERRRVAAAGKAHAQQEDERRTSDAVGEVLDDVPPPRVVEGARGRLQNLDLMMKGMLGASGGSSTRSN